MHKIIIAGIGTDVGKTIVSAIFTAMLKADFWKPVECGEESDSAVVAKLVEHTGGTIHPPAYSLPAPVSPHHAARLARNPIDIVKILPPPVQRSLVIEMCGGVCVPFTLEALSLDVMAEWKAEWIVVSRHYLGSINHSLLTLEALKSRGIAPAGIIFNGIPNPDLEEAILTFSGISRFARLLPEKTFTPPLILNYAKQWAPNFSLQKA